MKLDVWGHKRRYENWKEEIKATDLQEGLTKENSSFLIEFIFDMENGNNVSVKTRKGARSFIRLNNLRQRLTWILKQLQERGIDDVRVLSKLEKEKVLIQLFNEMRSGILKKNDGGVYHSVDSYANVITTAWHWWMKVNRKRGKSIVDITEDLDKKAGKSSFVYLTKEQLDAMLPYFDQDEQVILKFVFDSIIRSPTELLSLKVKDVYLQNAK